MEIMTHEFNQITLTLHELHVIINALTAYLMALYEDYDKEDNHFLKDKLLGTINDVERARKALLKQDGTYYDIGEN